MLVDALKNKKINDDGGIFMPLGTALELSQAHVLLDNSLKLHGLFGRVPPRSCGCARVCVRCARPMDAESNVSNSPITIVSRPPLDNTVFYCSVPGVEMVYGVNSGVMKAEMIKKGFNEVRVTYSSDLVGTGGAPNLAGSRMDVPSLPVVSSVPTDLSSMPETMDQSTGLVTIGSHLPFTLPEPNRIVHVVASSVGHMDVEPISETPQTRLSLSKAVNVCLSIETTILDFQPNKPALERLLMLWELHTCVPVSRFRVGIDQFYSPLIEWSKDNVKKLPLSTHDKQLLINRIHVHAKTYLYLVSLSPDQLSSPDQKEKSISILKKEANDHFSQFIAVRNFEFFEKARETALSRQMLPLL
jgi:hypothetical protein